MRYIVVKKFTFAISHLLMSSCHKVVDNFCKCNDFLWLDPVDGSVDYTYHNEKNGHYTLLDHMIVSPCVVNDHNTVSFLAEDDNTSDHYAISLVCRIDTVPITKLRAGTCPNSRIKYQWNNANLDSYQSCLANELSNIILPITALLQWQM